MDSVKVTVIIPVFNMDKWLDDAISSVINQNIYEIEIICINDNSTDKSLKILERYKDNDTRVRIIDNHTNEGVAWCRNTGICEAKGEYVIFLDPDDYYPDMNILKMLYEKAKENNALICGGCFSDISPDGVIGCGEVFNNEYYYGYNFDKEGFIEYKDYQFDYGYHRFIYLKKFLVENEIFFPDLKRFQDPPFMVNAFIRAERFYAIPKVTYRYRYEHKKVNWTKEKINDFIYGAELNVQAAKENNYGVLFELTCKRVFVEHRIPLIENICLDESIFRKLGNAIFLYGDLSENVMQLYRDFSEEVLSEYAVLKSENTSLKEELVKTKTTCEILGNGFERIKNSYSYKLGLILTYVPRKVFKTCKVYTHSFCKNRGI